MKASSTTKITFIGIGAIGGFFAGKVAHFNNAHPEKPYEISLLTRQSSSGYFQAIRDNGITLKTPDGLMDVPASAFARITANAGDIVRQSQDYTFISVKLFDVTPELLQHAFDSVKPGGSVVWACNGIPPWFTGTYLRDGKFLKSVDHNGQLADIIKTETDKGKNLIGTVLNIANTVESPGIIHVYRAQRDIIIPLGPTDGDFISDKEEALRDIFVAAGIHASTDSNIVEEVIRKLQVNVTVNGLSALKDWTIGQLQEDPITRIIMFAAAEEIRILGATLDIHNLRDEAELAKRLKGSSHHKASMCEDMRTKGRTEVNAIYDAASELYELRKRSNKSLVVVKSLATLVRIKESVRQIELICTKHKKSSTLFSYADSHEILEHLKAIEALYTSKGFIEYKPTEALQLAGNAVQTDSNPLSVLENFTETLNNAISQQLAILARGIDRNKRRSHSIDVIYTDDAPPTPEQALASEESEREKQLSATSNPPTSVRPLTPSQLVARVERLEGVVSEISRYKQYLNSSRDDGSSSDSSEGPEAFIQEVALTMNIFDRSNCTYFHNAGTKVVKIQITALPEGHELSHLDRWSKINILNNLIKEIGAEQPAPHAKHFYVTFGPKDYDRIIQWVRERNIPESDRDPYSRTQELRMARAAGASVVTSSTPGLSLQQQVATRR